MTEKSDDQRPDELAALVLRLAAGEYDARGIPSESRDEIDAIIVGMNLLAETLQKERAGREEAEALLRDEVHAYEFAPAMFCSIEGRSKTLVKCNSAFAHAVGLDTAQLVGRSLVEFLPEEERPALDDVLRDVVEGREPTRTNFRLASADGKERSVSLSASRSEDGESRRVRLILRDVTRERSLEAQLRQAQKLEAVGRLASGVAHDFNNILTVVLGATSLIEELDGADCRAEVQVIREASEQASALTRQLLTFARADLSQPAVHDLNSLVRDALPMLARTLGEAIELEVELHDGPLPIRIDANQLSQVLLNVVLNGRDAIGDNGRLRLQTHEDGGEAVLTATDDGDGMAPEVLERAFEPFFTTKQASKGSGLGLAVCYGIVQQARGRLELSSRAGVGTTVRISIPISDGEEAPVRPRSPEQSHPGNGERILVVDDTPAVLHLMQRVLTRAGYEVSIASGGDSALALAAEATDTDLLVTDVVMPQMSGPELARALWSQAADLPVLFVSGYTDDRLDGAILERPGVRFLQKPFDARRLTQLVSELLAVRTGET